MDLSAIQSALTDAQLDGWLFYDHHYRDPLAYRILGLPDDLHVTRRWFYYIPAAGTPKKLVHRIESGRLDTLPGPRSEYSSWQELEAGIEALLAGQTKVAMQYSPRNAIMYVALVDAGTVELLRSLGKEIVTSANLISQFEAVLTDAQIATHFAAGEKIDRIVEAGFKEIGTRVRGGSTGASGETHEQAIVEFLQEGMRREGLVWEHGTNVSVGAHSADSHYHPAPETSAPIRTGDFVLIDIWARLDQPNSCYYDITWTGVVGREPTEREQHIFATVREARDAACAAVTSAFAANDPMAGWQADDASRAVIRNAGLGEFFTHRTGHNIGNSLHGSGAHLDNLETHDERWLLPNTCFSVEPGLYFPGEFGVRSEVNMIARKGKAVVTGLIQRELVRI
jgi:Xaa-Pro aminopeptidase